ncbi:MAG: ribosome silencing factor [Hyphomonadaceae bacterium]
MLQGPQRRSELSATEKRTPARSSGGKPPSSTDAAPVAARRKVKSGIAAARAAEVILHALEEDKAEDIISIDIKGKSSLADVLIVASGRSQRHVAALADHLVTKLKEAGAGQVAVEGLPHADWVCVDAGDVIVHLFRPEVRSFYNIERIWSQTAPLRSAQA